VLNVQNPLKVNDCPPEQVQVLLTTEAEVYGADTVWQDRQLVEVEPSQLIQEG